MHHARVSSIATSCSLSCYPIFHDWLNFPFNASNIMKINALLGALRITVIPHPRYSPLIPYNLYIESPSAQKRALGEEEWTLLVCIRDLTVSAGKNRKLYDMPAEAPANACCHNGSGARALPRATGFEDAMRVFSLAEALEFQCRKAKVTVSLLPNQAAHPPVSRISVPSCPFQNPRMP